MKSLVVFAMLAVFPGVASAAGPAPDEFFNKALKGDQSEIDLGQLAQQKGNSQSIKDFGRTLETDHKQAKQKVEQAASAAGVKLGPAEPTEEAKKERTKLEPMSGPAFDREFAKYMIEDHKSDIADFEKASKSDNQHVAQLAQATLPTLNKHLQMAQAAQTAAQASR